MSSLMFYTHPMSRGRLVRWMLEEVGEPYDTTILDYTTSLQSDWYRAINPMAKIPSIQHGNQVVTECAAICAYLADAFPSSNLAPKIEARDDYYRWLFFAAGPLEQATVNEAIGVRLSEQQQGMAGYGSLTRVADTLSNLLKDREYVAADHFTSADLYLASQMQWNMDMGVLEKRTEFSTYTQRIHSRPAHTRAKHIDDEAQANLEHS